MSVLNGLPVIQFLPADHRYLSGIETVVPYRIGPKLKETIDSYRNGAKTQDHDWENLRQELGAIEIRATGDSDSFGLLVRLPDTATDCDIAMKRDDRRSDNPRLKYYVAPRLLRPTDSDDRSAWWALSDNHYGNSIDSDSGDIHRESRALLERAKHIHFADKWEKIFWNDYADKMTEGLKDIPHPDRADLPYFMAGHGSIFWDNYNYGYQNEGPQKQIADEVGVILLPRYSSWEIDPELSDESYQTAKAFVAVHLQLEGAEPISYEEAFIALAEAGRHHEIYPIDGFADASWAEFNPVPADLTLTPRYQYFELAPERREIIAASEAKAQLVEALHQKMIEEYGVEKFNYDGGKEFAAYVDSATNPWRPGWKTDSKWREGEKQWWKINIDHEAKDPELVAYLKAYYLDHPTEKYFKDLCDEVCGITAPVLSNYLDHDVLPKNMQRYFNGYDGRYPHTMDTETTTLLAYPSPVFGDKETMYLERLYHQEPELFIGNPDKECDRLAIFIKNARALTYAQAGAILEAAGQLPSAEAMRGATGGQPLILKQPTP